ncbi:MAG TPA: RNA polymerase sigma factor [Gaiellaceae bacterium]|jgi:RNA polymerase sigma-70 factor (ECF subfamily)|nr:RNA polymerase sigma factor [Gaiellaceae bacterium]
MAISVVDDRVFERLYRLHRRDVYRFALSLSRNPTEAEDVTQATFLNAYRALRAGEQPRRPTSWLLAIAHNVARTRVRRAMRRPHEVPLEAAAEQLVVQEPERTNLRELLRALGRLPLNQRTAITMRELEGRSYTEIADTLGVTVAAVEALLSRARRTLREHAAAIRGSLGLAGLPRPLRKLFEHGDAATGGAIGAGVAAKAVAIVVAGAAVTGGIGYATVEASPPAAKPVPRLEPRSHAAAPARVRRESVRSARAAPAATRMHAEITGVPVRPRPLLDGMRRGSSPAGSSTAAASSSSPSYASAPPGAPQPAPAGVPPAARPVQDAVDQTVPQVATAVEDVAAAAPAPLPVQPPPLPALPEPPPLPAVPPPPSLP